MVENPPAFPVKDYDDGLQYHGMTLRDWFAGQAIGAIIAATSAGQHMPGDGPADARPIRERLAWDAYAIADALLAERSN